MGRHHGRAWGVFVALVVLLSAAPASLAGAGPVRGVPVIEDPADDASLSPVTVDGWLGAALEDLNGTTGENLTGDEITWDPYFQVGPIVYDPTISVPVPETPGPPVPAPAVPRAPLPDHLDLREGRLATGADVLTVQLETEHLDEEIHRSAYTLSFTTSTAGPDRVHELTCRIGEHLDHLEDAAECWFEFTTDEPDPTCVPQPCYETRLHTVGHARLHPAADTVEAMIPYPWFEGGPGAVLGELTAKTWRCTSVPTEDMQPFFDGVPDNECGVVDEGTAEDGYELT